MHMGPQYHIQYYIWYHSPGSAGYVTAAEVLTMAHLCMPFTSCGPGPVALTKPHSTTTCHDNPDRSFALTELPACFLCCAVTRCDMLCCASLLAGRCVPRSPCLQMWMQLCPAAMLLCAPTSSGQSCLNTS